MSESHRSHVLVSTNRVYKKYKPAAASFVDMSEDLDVLELATKACAANQAFSPDVYLGCSDIYEGDAVVDRVVMMRRLDAEDQVANLFGHGSDSEVIKLVARQIAALHAARTPVFGADANAGGGAAIVRAWLNNLDVIGDHAPRVIDQAKFDEVQRLAATYLAGRAKLFRDRVSHGWVRPAHGNLSATNLFLTADGPRLINCDISDKGFRIADALADVARLAVDLDRLVGPRAAIELLEAWDDSAGDASPSSLGYFYVAFRAHELCKKACLDYADGDPAARETARSYHEQALRYLRLAKVRLILVGGGQGAGKSTMAEAIARRTGAVWLQADEIGRQITGTAGRADRLGVDHTTEQNLPSTSTVHVEMMRRARGLLQEGKSVVLDASWRDADYREEARRLVKETATTIAEVCCTVPARDASERLTRRVGAMHNAPQVRPAAIENAAAVFSDWTEAAHIDTSGEMDDSVDAACIAIGLVTAPRRPSTIPAARAVLDLDALQTVVEASERALVGDGVAV